MTCNELSPESCEESGKLSAFRKEIETPLQEPTLGPTRASSATSDKIIMTKMSLTSNIPTETPRYCQDFDG